MAFYCYIRLYWLYVAIYGCVWLYVAIYGCTWLYLAMYGYTWLYRFKILPKRVKSCIKWNPEGFATLKNTWNAYLGILVPLQAVSKTLTNTWKRNMRCLRKLWECFIQIHYPNKLPKRKNLWSTVFCFTQLCSQSDIAMDMHRFTSNLFSPTKRNLRGSYFFYQNWSVSDGRPVPPVPPRWFPRDVWHCPQMPKNVLVRG